jgi:hypothetical protein
VRLPGWPLLAALCVAAVAIVVVLGTQLTFFNDDWYFLLQRPGLASKPGLDEFLAPHNGHLVLIPVAVYKLLVAVFGLGTQVPFRLVLGLEIAAVGVAVYALVVGRSTVPIALCASAIVVLLGPAWEDLLFINPMDLLGALALGLAALGVLERDTPRRNALACGLLVLAVCMSNAGIPFVVAAAVAIALRRRVSQAWVAAVPALVFAAWYAGWGHTAPTGLSATNLAHLPKYVAHSAGMGLVSITGLNRGVDVDHYLLGYVLLALLAAAMIARWVRRGPPPAWVAVPAVAALGFWALTGAGYTPGREPLASRYQLIDAALILVTCAAWFAPLRPGRAATVAIAVVAVAAIASNLQTLFGPGYSFMRTQAAFARTDIGALEIAGPRAAARAWLLEPVARNPYLSGITGNRYFAVSRAHGAPAFDTPAEITAAPPDRRAAADSVLASAYAIKGHRAAWAGGSPDCAPGPDVPVGSGDVDIRNRGADPLVLGVRRFAPRGSYANFGFVPPRTTIRTHIPRDALARGWYVGVTAPDNGPVDATICPR